ncbi:hypothetical protein J3Q64DRAFT_1725498 [Phycomyces blakesleeanus]|uniref:Uncharacterized protein n=1 Tax=Phycomyces blakesleeanus TaxID=4837 RepID=A0ABR3B768_PHYBL
MNESVSTFLSFLFLVCLFFCYSITSLYISKARKENTTVSSKTTTSHMLSIIGGTGESVQTMYSCFHMNRCSELEFSDLRVQSIYIYTYKNDELDIRDNSPKFYPRTNHVFQFRLHYVD